MSTQNSINSTYPIGVVSGGTGAATLTGVLLGNGTSAVTAVTAGDYGVLISSSSGVPSWLANGTTGQVLTATSSGTPSWVAPATSGTVTSLTEGTGITLSPSTITSTGSIGLTVPVVVSSGGTGAITLTGVLTGNGTSAVTANTVTQYDVLVGGASNAVGSVGPGSSGQVLQSGGASANPAYSTATYPATTTINQLLYSSANNTVGGVTAGDYGVLISSSSGVPSWLANGTTGQVLTATTSGTPSWANAAAGGITTIDGNSGSATGSTVTITTGASNAQGTAKFAGASSTLTLDFTDANKNTVIGYESLPAGSGIGYNVGLGASVLSNVTSGGWNVALGAESASSIVAGNYNVIIGYSAGADNGDASNNVIIGAGSQLGLSTATGSYNTIIGPGVGGNYTGTESHNIIIGASGTAGENYATHIANIWGTTVGSTGAIVLCDSSGLMGTVSLDSGQVLIGYNIYEQPVASTLSAGTGISISNGAGSITISSTVSSGIGTLYGDSVGGGSATGSSVTFVATTNSGFHGQGTSYFQGSGSSMYLNFTDGYNNTVLGLSSFTSWGSSGQGQNCCLGAQSLQNLTSGRSNVVMGYLAGNSITTSNYNVCIGYISDGAGTSNTMIGYGATMGTGAHGSSNLILGSGSGGAYTGTESGNVLINATGTAGDSGKTYIGGISGTTVTGSAVLCSSKGLLGTVSSSRRFKENIVDMGDTGSVYKLRPVTFNYISDTLKTLTYGLIAEEVEEVMPSLVLYDSKTNQVDSVKYHEMPAILLNELQKLAARVHYLESKLTSLNQG